MAITSIEEAVKILDEHNKWRRWDGIGNSPSQQSVYKIGEAIDVVVRYFNKKKAKK